jgi:acyl-CoA thioesterase-1
LLAAGLVVAALAALVPLLVPGGATGAVAQHCARLALASQARERLVTGHGDRVVVIGDSYSVGLGLHHPEDSWPTELPGRVQVYGFSGSGFSAHASGCRAVAYADRTPAAIHNGADLVVVEGGLNDYDQPAAAVRSGFRTLVGELAGRRLLVVGPPAAPARDAGARRVDAILREEAALADVPYLSMLGRHFDYLDDELHLTPAGHRAFGDAVATALPR